MTPLEIVVTHHRNKVGLQTLCDGSHCDSNAAGIAVAESGRSSQAYILESPMTEKILAFLVQFVTQVIELAGTPALLR